MSERRPRSHFGLNEINSIVDLVADHQEARISIEWVHYSLQKNIQRPIYDTLLQEGVTRLYIPDTD